MSKFYRKQNGNHPIVVEKLKGNPYPRWSWQGHTPEGHYVYRIVSGTVRLYKGEVVFKKGDTWRRRSGLPREWEEYTPKSRKKKVSPKTASALKNPCPNCEARERLKGHYLCELCAYGIE